MEQIALLMAPVSVPCKHPFFFFVSSQFSMGRKWGPIWMRACNMIVLLIIVLVTQFYFITFAACRILNGGNISNLSFFCNNVFMYK